MTTSSLYAKVKLRIRAGDKRTRQSIRARRTMVEAKTVVSSYQLSNSDIRTQWNLLVDYVPPVVDNQKTKWAIRNSDDYEERAADCANVCSLWMRGFSPRSRTFKWDRGWTSRELHHKASCSHDILGKMEFRKRNYDIFWLLGLNSNIS